MELKNKIIYLLFAGICMTNLNSVSYLIKIDDSVYNGAISVDPFVDDNGGVPVSTCASNEIELTLPELKLLIANNEDVRGVCTFGITDMSELFYENGTFNQDISSWDVSNVTTMNQMFRKASVFNQDISDWNVGNVTDMSNMFDEATQFNQEIGIWNVNKVTNMNSMFRYTTSFNKYIGDWDVSNVTSMGSQKG